MNPNTLQAGQPAQSRRQRPSTISEVSTMKIPIEHEHRANSSYDHDEDLPHSDEAPASHEAASRPWISWICMGGLMVVESALFIISLVPATFTARLNWSATDGPFPASTAPLVTIIFYLAPFIIGALARRWEVAVIGATLPAWFAIGIYNVSTSSQDGIFAFVHNSQPSYLVGALELFAALGGIGWLTRRVVRPAPTQ